MLILMVGFQNQSRLSCYWIGKDSGRGFGFVAIPLQENHSLPQRKTGASQTTVFGS